MAARLLTIVLLVCATVASARSSISGEDEWLEIAATPASKTGRKTSVLDPKTSGIAKEVSGIVLDFLNQRVTSCKTPEHPTFTSVDVQSIQKQVVSGMLVLASVSATRETGSVGTYHLELREQLQSRPMSPPSYRTGALPARHALDKWQLHTVKPDPCITFQSNSEAELVQPEMLFGYIPESEGEYVDADVELTQQQIDSLPSAFSWLSKAPEMRALEVGKQECGNCWAWASAAAMSARFYVQTNGRENIRLSPQWFTSCGSHKGCNGGNAAQAYGAMGRGQWDGFLKKVNGGKSPGAVTEECNPPRGKDSTDASAKCEVSDGQPIKSDCGRYFAKQAAKRKGIFCNAGGCDKHMNNYFKQTSYAKRFWEIPSIKHELMTNGPLVASFMVYKDLMSYKSGVYEHKTQKKVQGHAVVLLGWGTDPATQQEYWLLQNSWGKHWGEEGYFKMRLGTNEAGVEGNKQSGGFFAGSPDVESLCPNACDHGTMTKDCKCTCDAGYGGDGCTECKLDCTGNEKFTGKLVENYLGTTRCHCECAAGYHGPNCQLHAVFPATSASGASFTFKLDQPENDPVVKVDTKNKYNQRRGDGDRIAVFRQSATPWTKEAGWARAEVPLYDPTELRNTRDCPITRDMKTPRTYDGVTYQHGNCEYMSEQGLCCQGASDEDLAAGRVPDDVYEAMKKKPLWNKWHSPTMSDSQLKRYLPGKCKAWRMPRRCARYCGACGGSKASEQKMTLYEPGTYVILLLKNLGFNAWGNLRGFSRDFVPLATITVPECNGECTPAPSKCRNTPWYHWCTYDNPKKPGEFTKFRCFHNWEDYTAHGIMSFQELCPKACGICGGGTRAPAPPPPPAPPGTGVVSDSCVKKHSLISGQQCLSNDQCAVGSFCCNRLMKCVPNGQYSVWHFLDLPVVKSPIANCDPRCTLDNLEACADGRCLHAYFGSVDKMKTLWQKPTCS